MIHACKYLVSIVLFLACLSSPAFSFDGPLQINNLYPLFLHADQQYLEKAAIENSMSYSLSHSSTYTVQESRDWIIHLDMEITELSFRYKRIMLNAFEFDLDVPVLIFGGGFIDSALEKYHDACGCGDYGRSGRPHNEFLYEVRREGALIIEGKSGTTLGDIRLSVKSPLLSSDSYTLSARGDIEVPIGNAKKGYGNGSFDAGGSLLLDKKLSDRTVTYWNLGAVFPGDVKGHETLNLKNYIFGGAALNMFIGDNFSALIQLYGQSPIYPYTDLDAVDGSAYLIAFGGTYYRGNRSFELSLSEDLNTTGVPDFIINFTYKHLL